MCSDLSQYHVAQAVTASSAVPVLLTPVTLENRAGACGYQLAPLPAIPNTWSEAAARLRSIERSRASYLDRDRRRYIHLMDGGISDNLGLRGLYDRVLIDGGIENTLRATGNANVRDVAVISVNAQTEPAFHWDLQNVSPNLPAVLDAVTSVQINRYNFETVALLQTAFEQWTTALSNDAHPVRFHFISVSFGDLRDERSALFQRSPHELRSRARGCRSAARGRSAAPASVAGLPGAPGETQVDQAAEHPPRGRRRVTSWSQPPSPAGNVTGSARPHSTWAQRRPKGGPGPLSMVASPAARCSTISLSPMTPGHCRHPRNLAGARRPPGRLLGLRAEQKF